MYGYSTSFNGKSQSRRCLHRSQKQMALVAMVVVKGERKMKEQSSSRG